MRQAILLEPADLDSLRRGIGLHLVLGAEHVTLMFARRAIPLLAASNGHVTVAPPRHGKRSPLAGRKLTGKALRSARKAAAHARAARAAQLAASNGTGKRGKGGER